MTTLLNANELLAPTAPVAAPETGDPCICTDEQASPSMLTAATPDESKQPPSNRQSGFEIACDCCTTVFEACPLLAIPVTLGKHLWLCPRCGSPTVAITDRPNLGGV